MHPRPNDTLTVEVFWDGAQAVTYVDELNRLAKVSGSLLHDTQFRFTTWFKTEAMLKPVTSHKVVQMPKRIVG